MWLLVRIIDLVVLGDTDLPDADDGEASDVEYFGIFFLFFNFKKSVVRKKKKCKQIPKNCVDLKIVPLK